MHKKIPKICTGCRVSAAKIYLYHSTEIAQARPHSEEWQTDTSVQKQWSMTRPIKMGLKFLPGTVVGECVRYSMHAAPVPCPNKVTF